MPIIQQNKKIILITIIVILALSGVLTLIYFTFGRTISGTIPNNLNQSSSLSKNYTFDDSKDSLGGDKDQPEESISSVANSKSGEVQNPNVGIKPKLVESPKIDYNFSSTDVDNISKYIELNAEDLKQRITSSLKDSKSNNVIVLDIPLENITKATNKDFINTFVFPNDDRPVTSEKRVFLYYPEEDRVAFVGDYISSINSFDYEGQQYWLSIYYGDIVISKPDFKDWRFVDVGVNKIADISKKNNFEFEVIKVFNYEDFEEYIKEVISPQKYIVNGLTGLGED
jgi:hypothetical protein